MIGGTEKKAETQTLRTMLAFACCHFLQRLTAQEDDETKVNMFGHNDIFPFGGGKESLCSNLGQTGWPHRSFGPNGHV